jgi:hypothetical protein
MTHAEQIATITEAFWRDRAPAEWLPQSDEITAAYTEPAPDDRPIGDVASLPREEQVALIRQAYWAGRAPALSTHPWLAAAADLLLAHAAIAKLKAAA